MYTFAGKSCVLIQIVGLFCRISSILWGSFVKETYNFKEPTNHSHPPIHVSIRGQKLCIVSKSRIYHEKRQSYFLSPTSAESIISISYLFNRTQSRASRGCGGCDHDSPWQPIHVYGLAAISRLLKIIGPFCGISSLL